MSMVLLLWIEFTLWRCVFNSSISNQALYYTLYIYIRVQYMHFLIWIRTRIYKHTHTFIFFWLVFTFIQVIVLSWVYGIDRVFDNLSQMNMRFGGGLRAYWWTVWTLVTPIASFVSIWSIHIVCIVFHMDHATKMTNPHCKPHHHHIPYAAYINRSTRKPIEIHIHITNCEYSQNKKTTT